MTATLTSSGHPHQSARVGPVARELARRLGLTPGSAHQVLRGPLAHRCAEVVLSFTACRDFAGLALWDAPIREAYDAATCPVTSLHDLVRAASDADLHEESCEREHLMAGTLDTARAWIRAIDRQESTGQALKRALAAQFGLTL